MPIISRPDCLYRLAQKSPKWLSLSEYDVADILFCFGRRKRTETAYKAVVCVYLGIELSENGWVFWFECCRNHRYNVIKQSLLSGYFVSNIESGLCKYTDWHHFMMSCVTGYFDTTRGVQTNTLIINLGKSLKWCKMQDWQLLQWQISCLKNSWFCNTSMSNFHPYASMYSWKNCIFQLF